MAQVFVLFKSLVLVVAAGLVLNESGSNIKEYMRLRSTCMPSDAISVLVLVCLLQSAVNIICIVVTASLGLSNFDVVTPVNGGISDLIPVLLMISMSISSKIELVKSVETNENSVIPATESIDEDSCTETDSSQCSLQSNSFEEYSNQAQVDYISQAAHDLNTPLQSFQLSLELLHQSAVTVVQDDILLQASVAVALMKRIIQCALDAQRLSAGFSLQPHIALTNLCDVNNRVSTFMQSARSTPTVLFQTTPDVCNSVYTDDEWLCQVLTTVIEQSHKKATDCPISVHIRTAEASKPWCVDATPARVLLFEISVPNSTECWTWPELNYRAFPSFGTPSSAASGDIHMQVMRARIEALQGTCGTYVTAGKGSVVWFAVPYVPVVEVNSPVSVADIESPKTTIGYHALTMPVSMSAEDVLRTRIRSANFVAMLIEDTPSIRKLMERTLLQIGFSTVHCYEDGQQGLAAMLTQPVDIVFSDVQMPLLCGDDMVRAFRQQEVTMLQSKSRLQKQLIVAVTANGAEFKDLLGAGFDAVYPKPVSRKTLLSVVVDYLDNKWQNSLI